MHNTPCASLTGTKYSISFICLKLILTVIDSFISHYFNPRPLYFMQFMNNHIKSLCLSDHPEPWCMTSVPLCHVKGHRSQKAQACLCWLLLFWLFHSFLFLWAFWYCQRVDSIALKLTLQILLLWRYWWGPHHIGRFWMWLQPFPLWFWKCPS